MERPEEIFDREVEWRDLVDFVEHEGAGTRLALVRGRHRQGKSYLLRRLASVTDGFYYQAVEEERSQALAGFGAALGAYLEVPGRRLALRDWEEAVTALGEISTAATNSVVVIDEFPYLLRHSPELPSLLQRFIDRTCDSDRRLRLILCGSALSVMAELLEGSQALRGRASTDLIVRTFDYRTSAEFWGIADPTTAFLVHATIGGTPGYRDLLPARPPRRADDLVTWLAAGPLNPASAMFREDDYLLAEQRSLSNRAMYHSLVAAIAAGNTGQAAIARAVGREQRSIQHPLRSLEDAGFITATDDALRSRRPIYQIVDPIVRFHHVVTRHDLARFEDRRTELAWAAAQPRFRTHVLGPHFEHLAREFTLHHASATTIGAAPTSVAPAVVNDPARRTQHEVDIVAIGRNDDGSTCVVALGEAKHTTVNRTPSDLDRLEDLRALVAKTNPSAKACKLLLFSAFGFDRNLIAQASTRADVELIDMHRLYEGD